MYRVVKQSQLQIRVFDLPGNLRQSSKTLSHVEGMLKIELGQRALEDGYCYKY